MRVYLDVCCFNRPFDGQEQARVRLEADAKLRIQERILAGEIELAWSYILDFENAANPFDERREAIAAWRSVSVVDLSETPDLLARAKSLARRGLRSKDAIHVACAVGAGCDYFITTDDGILKRLADYVEIAALDPMTFVRRTEP